MKKLVLLLIVLCFVSACKKAENQVQISLINQANCTYNAKDVNLADKLGTAGVMVDISTDKQGNPITGVVCSYFESGELGFVYLFKNGLLDGLTKFYHKNGRLGVEIPFKQGVVDGVFKIYHGNGDLGEITYVDGKREGLKEYYESGVLKSEATYKNDEFEGQATTYYKNSNIESTCYFRNGKREGIERNYYESGELRSEIPFVNGLRKGLGKAYYKNGNLKSQSLLDNDMRNGAWSAYYENGALKQEGFMIDEVKSDGVGRMYYENGQLQIEMNYKNGLEDGGMKAYYNSGALMLAGFFEDGKAEGIDMYYRESGEKWMVIENENDVAINGTCFQLDGKERTFTDEELEFYTNDEYENNDYDSDTESIMDFIEAMEAFCE
jgi:antitoxin component YwqK of YwqJK toxin-antitoxin module